MVLPWCVNLCPHETGLGPGTLCCRAAKLAPGCTSPQATQFRETTWDCVLAQLGQILDQKISKKEEKNALLSFLKSQEQKKKLGVGSKSGVLFMPSALTITKKWANHLRHPSSQPLDSPSPHRRLSLPPSSGSKQGTSVTCFSSLCSRHMSPRKPCLNFSSGLFVVQSLSCVRLFATPRTAAHQASLSCSISQSLLRFMSIESVMPCHPLSSPSPPALNLSQHQGLFQ